MAHELSKRVRILDGQHAKVGQKMVEWVMDEYARPKTVQEFADQLAGLADVDVARLKEKVTFVETPIDEIVIRLPPREMVQASLDRANDPTFDLADYNLPNYYPMNAAELGLSALELFKSRVGDYTTGECE